MFDRYYTPSKFAKDMLAPLRGLDVAVCCDTSCGTGALLMAAEAQYGGTRCVGIDSDVQVIRRLRRAKPGWILSCGDVLAEKSVRRCRAISYAHTCDLLLLNPPFSENGKRTHSYIGDDERVIRCSIAMRHVLTSLELVRPKTAVAAIVPETSWFSVLDNDARVELERVVSIVDVKEIPSNAFSGARARSLAICGVVRNAKMAPPSAPLRGAHEFVGFKGKIVRGGLPTFQAMSSRNGIPYIHSTDIVRLAKCSQTRLPRVVSSQRGVVSGWCVFLPRVGLPSRSAIRAVFLRRRTQLSDCVISLCFTNEADAEHWATSLSSDYAELCAIYRGTGARYTTIERLSQWLDTKSSESPAT